MAGFCPEGPECEKVHPKWSFSEAIRIRAKGEVINPKYSEQGDVMMADASGYGGKDGTGSEDVIKVLR